MDIAGVVRLLSEFGVGGYCSYFKRVVFWCLTPGVLDGGV